MNTGHDGVVGKPVRHWRQGRLAAAGAVALLHLLAGYALIAAFGVALPLPPADSAIKLFDVLPPRASSPPPPPPRIAPPRPERAPAPSGLRATPSPAVAPPPLIPLPAPPPPILVAPVADAGAASSAGAAAIGSGTGAGGEGDGRGGSGDGGYSPPRWLRGEVRGSDYPRGVDTVALGERMTVQFTVRPDGRVSGCTTIESSGSPILDDATCRAIERRYRYEPSRDPEGRPVPSMVVESHRWSRR